MGDFIFHVVKKRMWGWTTFGPFLPRHLRAPCATLHLLASGSPVRTSRSNRGLQDFSVSSRGSCRAEKRYATGSTAQAAHGSTLSCCRAPCVALPAGGALWRANPALWAHSWQEAEGRAASQIRQQRPHGAEHSNLDGRFSGSLIMSPGLISRGKLGGHAAPV